MKPSITLPSAEFLWYDRPISRALQCNPPITIKNTKTSTNPTETPKGNTNLLQSKMQEKD